MSFLSVSGISKRKGKNLVLKEISFTQQRFQKIAIAGETGSGKSTLLKIIAGLIQPNAGEVLFEQEKILGPEEKLMPGHKGIAYLSQHFELRNNYRVKELLSMANKMTDEEAATIYEVCRITHLLKRRTDELSGGEKQRIATALLLSSSPRLLLLDEPFSNLDMMHKNLMKAVIRDIEEKLEISSILISHDPLDTLSWADEIIVMKDGIILQRASPEEVYNRPVDEYVAGLFGRYNVLTPSQAKAFESISEKTKNGKNILIRPEGFTLTTEKSEGVKGIVDAVYFFGGYYELEVFTGGSFLHVKTTAANIVKDDTVYISLSPNAILYV